MQRGQGISKQDSGPETSSWENVPCPGCACVCDDVSLTFREHELVEFQPNCPLGERWFRVHGQAAGPLAEINGQPAEWTEAIDYAAALLQRADYPLIYGLSRSATPGQRAAVALAERLGTAIDTTASLCHGPSIMALQEVGEVTCTLGEIRNRADLIVFWGCNPAVSHPRHAERYSAFASGRYLPSGRADRTIVMVGDADQVHDWRLDVDGTRPDLVIPIAPGQDFEALALLRLMFRSGPVPKASPELQQLLDLMRGCRYGVVFFGLGITETSMWDGRAHPATGHVNVAMLLQLVADLNSHTRFTARRMRIQGDVSGADNVLCWQTGFPFAVDMSRGYPRYNPGEYSANELLAQQNTDLCLLVGAETVPYLSAAAREHLRAIPTIVLDYPGAELDFVPTVRFTTSVYGLNSPGTVYRMDNVPVSLKAPQATDAPTDEDVLTRIWERC
ncbi:MAG: formylmethanofuran dehydrogenase subunit B [Planctomycetaceae bacterium]